MEQRSNLSGIFFRPHLEQHLFLQNTLHLDAPVDLSCLAKAWRQTLRTCPFFEQGIEIENDHLVYVPRRSKCQVTDFSEKKPYADGDLAWVQAEDNKIRVGVSHALTDEFGKKLFTSLLLYHYFCLADGRIYPNPFMDSAGRLPSWDPDTDLLNPAFFPADWADAPAPPEISFPEKSFIYPEHQEEQKTGAQYRLSVDAEEFFRVCRDFFPISERDFREANINLLPIGRIQCLFLYLLMGRVILKQFPENPEPIGVRFPVNLRAFCRKDHALRNFSLHQAAAICDPKSFYREALAEGGSGLIALLVKELRPESLVYAINWIKRRAEGQPFPNDMAIRWHQTMLITNVGKEYYEPEKGRILDDCRVAAGGYPMAVYLNRVQGRQLITMTQSFSTDRYYRGLIAELEETGLRTESLE